MPVEATCQPLKEIIYYFMFPGNISFVWCLFLRPSHLSLIIRVASSSLCLTGSWGCVTRRVLRPPGSERNSRRGICRCLGPSCCNGWPLGWHVDATRGCHWDRSTPYSEAWETSPPWIDDGPNCVMLASPDSPTVETEKCRDSPAFTVLLLLWLWK